MKMSLIRKLIGGLSFTTALFVFQACYGTPQDMGLDVFIHGLVKSKKTGNPVPGIKVSIAGKTQYLYTDEQGRFQLYTEYADTCRVMFQDIDLENNGTFADKDTLLNNLTDQVYLNVFLEEK